MPSSYFDDYAGRPAAARQEMNIYRDMYEGHDLKMTTRACSTELRYDPWKGAFGRMTEAQRKYITGLDTTQLIRLHGRIFERIGYGWDMPTLRACHPHLHAVLRAMSAHYNSLAS